MNEISQFVKNLNEMLIVQSAPELARAYDIAIMPSVSRLQEQLQEQCTTQEKIQQEKSKAFISQVSPEVLEHLDELSGDCSDNQVFLQEQMAVIAEMRLVYFYKSYEIILKRILIRAFGANSLDLSVWMNQKLLLESKNIYPAKIAGYKELNELRIIVNSIKHAGELNARSKRIFEFRNSDQISYESGTNFYNRIGPLVNAYVEKLSKRIFQELYLDTL